MVTFSDNGRTSSQDTKHAWQVLHQCTTIFQYLVLQIACRKIRPLPKKSAAWAGLAVCVSPTVIRKLVTQVKWDRAKHKLIGVREELNTSVDGWLNFKELERDKEFLIHIAVTYHPIVPHLKG